ncbi:hypothetical protein Vafri_11902 [Volvox africanus]|uniref:Protein kinase domain-containing protein n=1 Tax=Volvox africanus TaxID=51714 RepID=A0A8J4F1V1_9CHLO|nr:hypothetical protein Vafri_11902 [Volvox africanus]
MGPDHIGSCPQDIHTYILPMPQAADSGVPYRGLFVPSNAFFAVQIMRLAVREARVLQTLKHPAIIQLVEAFKSKSGRVYMVFPYGGLSTYQELEKHPDGFPDAQLKLLVWQLLQALVYLHRRKIVHRDIKPGNILVSEDWELKLCDFGFARATNSGPRGVERLTSYVVTRWYRAPEVLVGDEYGPSSDIWSLGCTVAELASGLPLFPGKSTGEQLWRIMRCFGALPESQMTHLSNCRRLTRVRVPVRGRCIRDRLRYCDPDLVRLVESCLQLDPRQRPTAAELLHAPYLSGVPGMMVGTPLEQVYSGLIQPQQQQQQQQQQGKTGQQERSTRASRSGYMPGTPSAVPTNASLCSDLPPALQGVAQQPGQVVSYSSRVKDGDYQPSKPATVSTAYLHDMAEEEEEQEEGKQEGAIHDTNSSMVPMSPEDVAGKQHQYLPADLEDAGQQQDAVLPQLRDPENKGCIPHTPGIMDNPTPGNQFAAASNGVGLVEVGTARSQDPRYGGFSLPALVQQKGGTCEASRAAANAAGAAAGISPFHLSGPKPMQQLNNTSVETVVAVAPASATSTPKLQTPQPSVPRAPRRRSWRSSCSVDTATIAAVAATGARTVNTCESTSTHVKASSRPMLAFKASDSLPGVVAAAQSGLEDERSTRSTFSTGGMLPSERRTLVSVSYQQQPPPHRFHSTINDAPRVLERTDSSFQLSALTTMDQSGLLLTTMMNTGTLALCDTAVFECCAHAPSDEAARAHAGPPAPNPCISVIDNMAISTVDLLGYQPPCKTTPTLNFGNSDYEPYPSLLLSTQGQRDADFQGQDDSMLDNLVSTTLRHMPCNSTSPTSHCISVGQTAPDNEFAAIEFPTVVGASALASNRRAKTASENISATAASSAVLADRGVLVVSTSMFSGSRDNPLAAINPDALAASVLKNRSLDRQRPPGIHGSFSPGAYHSNSTTQQGATRQLARQNYNSSLMMSADLHIDVVPKRLQHQSAGRYRRSQTALPSAETSRLVEPAGHSSGHILYAWEPAPTSTSAANGRLEPAVGDSRAADSIGQQGTAQRSLATAVDPTEGFLSNEGVVSSRSRLRMLSSVSNGRITPTNNALVGTGAAAIPSLSAAPPGSRSRLSIMMSSVSLSRVGLETTVDAMPGSPIQTIKMTRDGGACEETVTAAPRLLPPLANLPCRSARNTRMQPLPQQEAVGGALQYAVFGTHDRDVHREGGIEFGSHVSTRLKQKGKPQLAARSSTGSMADVTKKGALLRKWFKTVKGVFSTTKK